jgi:hypothetical protein
MISRLPVVSVMPVAQKYCGGPWRAIADALVEGRTLNGDEIVLVREDLATEKRRRAAWAETVAGAVAFEANCA